MRIHGFWDGGACGMIRVLLPLDALRDLGGHEVSTSYGWTAGQDMADRAELLIGQRFDRLEAAAIWRRLAARHRLVYEIDDDLWNVDPVNLQAQRLRLPSAQDAVQASIEVADLVTVTTEPLAELVSKFNRNVVVLPNCIDGRALELERPRRERLVVGWAGGSSHLRDLAHVTQPLQRFQRRSPQVDFHMVGTDYRKLMGLRGRHTPWEADLFTYYGTMDFDIGLAPLAPTVFNRSKSGIKAIEYMARGIPVIASDREPYRPIIRHGVDGFLVRLDHEWIKYLRELTYDRELRERMGRAARERVRRWTIQRRWKDWEAVYAGLLSKRALPVGV